MTVSSSSAGARPGICTSTNRPSSPYEGQIIYETDTDRTLQWTGIAWDMPNRPGTVPNFFVHFSGANGSAVNGATLAYNSELYDDMSNVVNGVFTVPNGHAGVYHFTCSANCYNIGSSGYFRIQIVTTGSSGAVAQGSQTPAQGSTDTFSTASLIVKLAVGDTVYTRWAVPATGNYSAGIIYNYFSGTRIR